MTRYQYHPNPLIDAAIGRVAKTHPYYVAAITDRLRIVADKNIPTMATSAAWVTHYNPDTLAGWTADQAGAVLVHELEHLLRRHAERCNGRDHGRWNIAGDAEINQRLTGLPDGCVYPETLGMPRGSVAEVYYAATKADPKPDAGDGQSGTGQPGEGSGAAGSGQPGNGPDCGSAAGGPKRPYEAGDAQRPGAGATGDGADARKEVAEGVIAGWHPGTGEGTEIRDWAEAEIGIDRAAWFRAMATAVGRTLANTGAPTAYRWPGRRDPSDVGGAMIPRWVAKRPACAVVIDVSSSVTAEDLNLARASAHYLDRMADVVYWTCNTRARRIGPILPDVLSGFGGTDLRVGIEAAIEDGARCVVVITDCGTLWPDADPGVPVIVASNVGARSILAAGPGSIYHPPAWVTIIPIVPNP